jgi:hypothetical protein
MPKKIQNITRGTLEAVPLPVHAATYTVISHKSIMDYALAEITAKGFTIFSEEYRATHDGQIAQGIYQLTYNSDPEMSLMFAWTNSYNKQIRFKCAVGGYVRSNQTVMLSGEIGTYARKHTGTADADTIAMMQSQLTNATMYYDNLVADKEEMKLISLDTHAQAQLLGVLFAQYEIINTEQASIIRQQMSKPSFFYNGGKDTLWSFYNHVTLALQQSHPRTWMEDQRILHWVITNEFTLNAPAPVVDATMQNVLVDPLTVIPNQTNLLDQIAELEIENDDTYDDTSDKNDDTSIEVTDNQVVQNGSDFDIDLHQSDEIIEDTNEDEENVLTEDELAHQLYGVDNDIEVSIPSVDLDAEEDADWEKLKVAGIITPCAAHDVETEKEETELVQYTDPAGNTFELPMIKESEIPAAVTQMPQEIMDALMNAPEMDVSKVDMSKVTWVDAPEVAPDRVKFAIDETEDDDFNITFDLGSDDVSTEHDEFF